MKTLKNVLSLNPYKPSNKNYMSISKYPTKASQITDNVINILKNNESNTIRN